VTTFDFFRDMKRRFAGKVRDVKYNAALGMVAALDTSGFVKLMDPITGLRVVRAVSPLLRYFCITITLQNHIPCENCWFYFRCGRL